MKIFQCGPAAFTDSVILKHRELVRSKEPWLMREAHLRFNMVILGVGAMLLDSVRFGLSGIMQVSAKHCANSIKYLVLAVFTAVFGLFFPQIGPNGAADSGIAPPLPLSQRIGRCVARLWKDVRGWLPLFVILSAALRLHYMNDEERAKLLALLKPLIQPVFDYFGKSNVYAVGLSALATTVVAVGGPYLGAWQRSTVYIYRHGDDKETWYRA